MRRFSRLGGNKPGSVVTPLGPVLYLDELLCYHVTAVTTKNKGANMCRVRGGTRASVGACALGALQTGGNSGNSGNNLSRISCFSFKCTRLARYHLARFCYHLLPPSEVSS